MTGVFGIAGWLADLFFKRSSFLDCAYNVASADLRRVAPIEMACQTARVSSTAARSNIPATAATRSLAHPSSPGSMNRQYAQVRKLLGCVATTLGGMWQEFGKYTDADQRRGP